MSFCSPKGRKERKQSSILAPYGHCFLRPILHVGKPQVLAKEPERSAPACRPPSSAWNTLWLYEAKDATSLFAE